MTNIERHAQLLREEVTFEHIRREEEARTTALEAFQKADDFQHLQNFQALETALNPPMYDDKLDWLRRRTYNGTAEWLMKNDAYIKWLDTTTRAAEILWLQGIPGAGKNSPAVWRYPAFWRRLMLNSR